MANYNIFSGFFLVVLLSGITFSHFSTVDPSTKWWTRYNIADEITGESKNIFIGPPTFPKRRMYSPYDDVKSRILVHCGISGCVINFQFFGGLNLDHNADEQDDYEVFKTKVWWDENDPTDHPIEMFFVKPEFSFLSDDDDDFIQPLENITFSDLRNHDVLLVELQWYKQGKVYFRYDLSELN